MIHLDYQEIQRDLFIHSISANSMSLFGPVDSVDKLCRHEVAQVLHTVRCGVYVVVATFSMVAEAVCVLHTQVQTLDTQQTHEQTHYKAAYFANTQCQKLIL